MDEVGGFDELIVKEKFLVLDLITRNAKIINDSKILLDKFIWWLESDICVYIQNEVIKKRELKHTIEASDP